MADEEQDGLLAGVRVLVVEDEYYLADDIGRALDASGAAVVGPASTLEEAERLIAAGAFDRAVLDMNLRGDMAWTIADRLRERGIPFVVASGYSGATLPERLAGVAFIEKPFRVERLVELIARLADDRAGDGRTP